MTACFHLLRTHSRCLLVLLVALTLSAACTRNSDPTPPRWIAEAENGNRFYLIGTFHLLPKKFPAPHDVISKLRNCRSLVVEVTDPSKTEMEAISKMIAGTAENNPSRLQPKLMDAAREAHGALGLSKDLLPDIKVWALSTRMLVIAATAAGYHGGLGADVVLRELASKSNVQIVALESIEEQFRFLDDQPFSDQVELLSAQILSINQGKTKSNLDRLYSAWALGREDEMMRLHVEESADTPSLARLDARLLAGRNENWATKITGITSPTGCSVVAVGALHFAGDQSLLKELESRGMRIRRTLSWED